MKKVLSLLLVLVMLLALGTTTLADETKGSIKITNAVAGETYSIYRLLDLESYDSESGAYAYKANKTWEAWLKTQTSYLTFDEQGYVTWKTGADVAEFATAAKAYAEANVIFPVETNKATGTELKFEDLELGYYLLGTSLGAICSLSTTDPDVEILEKNETIPVIKKEVEEDSNNTYGKVNDAEIGQTVNFKTTVTAKKGAENYVVHDILSSGLTLDQGSIKVKVGDATLTKCTDYTVSFNVSCTNSEGEDATCSFHVAFTKDYLDTINARTDIVITYSATVNENAVIDLDGNPNDTTLEYGVGSRTEWDETITYVWDLGVLKYANGDESKVLEGAKFVLLNSDKTMVARFENGKLVGWTTISSLTPSSPTTSEEGEPVTAAPDTEASITWPTNSILTTDANGKIEIDGLDSDTYYLREIEAPKGYNKLTDDIEANIIGREEVDKKFVYNPLVKKVNNQSGNKLPETGAKGTIAFITIGSLLAVAAVIFMVTRKKMSVYEK